MTQSKNLQAIDFMENLLDYLLKLAPHALESLLLMCSIMTCTWALASAIKNAGIVDIVWTLSFPLVYILLLVRSVAAWHPVQLLLLLSISLWSLRLSLHLLIRTIREKAEDQRYQEMRSSWGANANRNFFFFFIAQALSVVVLSLPMLQVVFTESPPNRIVIVTATLLFVFALICESIADVQLKNFRADKNNKGKVCDVGLWRYTRHPNYFFEWLVWCSFSLYALTFSYGWLSLSAAAIMLFFLLKVSGVPLAEKNSLKSKGELYKEYQRHTSEFFPWVRIN